MNCATENALIAQEGIVLNIGFYLSFQGHVRHSWNLKNVESFEGITLVLIIKAIREITVELQVIPDSGRKWIPRTFYPDSGDHHSLQCISLLLGSLLNYS